MARTSLAGIYKALKSLKGGNEVVLYCGTDIDLNFAVENFQKDFWEMILIYKSNSMVEGLKQFQNQ